MQGETIPLAGFAQMTFIGAVLGGIIVAVLNRHSSEPRRRFLQTAVVLTTLSCVPSIAFPSAAAPSWRWSSTHLVAAAIIVPVLARQAHDRALPVPNRTSDKEHTMPQYLISVWHDDEYDLDFTTPDRNGSARRSVR